MIRSRFVVGLSLGVGFLAGCQQDGKRLGGAHPGSSLADNNENPFIDGGGASYHCVSDEPVLTAPNHVSGEIVFTTQAPADMSDVTLEGYVVAPFLTSAEDCNGEAIEAIISKATPHQGPLEYFFTSAIVGRILNDQTGQQPSGTMYTFHHVIENLTFSWRPISGLEVYLLEVASATQVLVTFHHSKFASPFFQPFTRVYQNVWDMSEFHDTDMFDLVNGVPVIAPVNTFTAATKYPTRLVDNSGVRALVDQLIPPTLPGSSIVDTLTDDGYHWQFVGAE